MSRSGKFSAEVRSFEEVSEALRLIDRHLRALDTWLRAHAAECSGAPPRRPAQRRARARRRKVER